ncbi:MAG TPA: aminotransferase [Bacteroidetes bacterium]|nr:aminotransferase [Bacteroidota bacterium]HCN36667.1 aminotransferase [Bacteroidota bacterium]
MSFTGVIVQARMGSSRLPSKVLMEADGKKLLSYTIERLKNSKKIDNIIVATTDTNKDEAIEKFCIDNKIDFFRGDENDVLDRFYNASKKFNFKNIIRITADCPLIDYKIVDDVIDLFKSGKYDYVSNVDPPSFPDGLDVEIFSFDALEDAFNNAKLISEREHVTPYIRNNKKFKKTNLNNNRDLSNLRWTVDEKEDFDYISKILKSVNSKNYYCGLNEIIDLINEESDLNPENSKFFRNEGYIKSLLNDMKSKYQNSFALLNIAKKIIPSASQTYSKSYKYFVEGAAPAFIDRGLNAHVWDVDGNEFIDFSLGLGAITLGYNIPGQNEAIINQLQKGISFSLSNKIEIDVAQKIIDLYPSAEMVRFVKNGSDATTACIRLARAHTGKNVVAHCGYHGWQEWYIGKTDNDRGIPQTVKDLTQSFNYNDIDSLDKIFKNFKNDVAAVILEPIGLDYPKNDFLQKVKELTHKNNAILIFDEVVSGFRIDIGGAQSYFDVVPDLTAIGKGMSNGTSVSAITGRADLMKIIDEGAFISMTFGGETLALASASYTIDILSDKNNFQSIIDKGSMYLDGAKKIIKNKNLEDVALCPGYPTHCGIIFKPHNDLSPLELLSVFQQSLIADGFLTTGINNFCLTHTEDDINKYLTAIDKALDSVKYVCEKNSIKEVLAGELIRPIFKRN